MAYLGNDLQVAFPTYRNIDDISGSFNGVTTSFPLTVAGVAPIPAPINSQQCLISVNGVVQRPDDSGTEGFRLSGGNIIFASAPAGGVDFFGVILAGADYVNIGANFPSGTAVAPSITFDSDLDTGIYNPAGNQIGFTTSGVQRLVINSSGQISGGLGTAAAPVISFISDPNTGIYSPGADQVAISTGGTRRLIILSDGKVGLGAASVLQQGSGVDGGSAAGVLELYNGGTGNTTLENTGAFPILFKTNGSERLRITSAGLVGVGTSVPASLLTSYAGNVSTLGAKASTGLLIENNGSVGNISQIGLGYTFSSTNHPTAIAAVTTSGAGSTRADLVFATRDLTTDVAPTERMRIDSSGRVGIGSSTPVATNHIRGSGTSGQVTASWMLENASSGTVGMDVTGAAGSSIWRLLYGNGPSTGTNTLTPALTIGVEGSAAGCVGIGTTSPSSRLHVLNPSAGPEVSTIERDNSGVFLKLYRNAGSGNQGGLIGADSAGTYFAGGTSTAEMLYIDSGNSVMQFFTSGSERARIDSSGRLLVGTSSALTNVLIKGDLGSSAATTPQEQFALAANNYNAGLSVTNYSANGYGGVLSLNSSKSNTLGTNALVDNTIAVGTISFNGNDGTNFVPCAEIKAAVDGTPGTNDMPGRLVFSTTADGASSPTERMRISSTGKTIITADAGVSEPAIKWENTVNSSGAFGSVSFLGSNCNNTSSYHYIANTGAADKYYIFGNGTTGTPSDINLKKNIETTRDGYLEDLCRLRVVKYNWNEQTDDEPKELGVIAQELEQVFPGLVQQGPEKEDGSSYKAVKTSVLPFMLLKALQEAVAKIEILEAKVTVLESV